MCGRCWRPLSTREPATRLGPGHAGVEPTGRDEPRGVIRQRGANWGVSTWESPKRVACCTAESRSTTTSAPSKNSALKHTCCSSSEVSHLASTAEAMAASNWSRIAGSDRPARPVLCNQQWPNQRMARLKVGGGLGPGPSHRPGTRSLDCPLVDPAQHIDHDRSGDMGSGSGPPWGLAVFSPSRAGIGSAVSSKSNTSKLAAIRAGFTD